jgi:hypothetical protein
MGTRAKGVTYGKVLVILSITPFEDVHLGITDPWVMSSIEFPVVLPDFLGPATPNENTYQPPTRRSSVRGGKKKRYTHTEGALAALNSQ